MNRLSLAISKPRREGPAVVAYLTAGYPSRARFAELLVDAALEADVIEIGVPFSDPMADGGTIQRASAQALAQGTRLDDVLLAAQTVSARVPVVLMGYTNPFMARGFERLAEEARGAGVEGFIVPDMPLEEASPFADALSPRGLSLVQLVSPSSSDARLRRVCAASRGFVYAVTVNGTTGGPAAPVDLSYLRRVREASTAPVCAGFGISTADDVARLAPHVDGVIVGSSLLRAVDAGASPAAFLRGLKQPSAQRSAP